MQIKREDKVLEEGGEMTTKNNEPVYEYTESMKRRIPILNPDLIIDPRLSPDPKLQKILNEAEIQAIEIAIIAWNRDARGGRAG
jgi:hypothetical protein